MKITMYTSWMCFDRACLGSREDSSPGTDLAGATQKYEFLKIVPSPPRSLTASTTAVAQAHLRWHFDQRAVISSPRFRVSWDVRKFNLKLRQFDFQRDVRNQDGSSRQFCSGSHFFWKEEPEHHPHPCCFFLGIKSFLTNSQQGQKIDTFKESKQFHSLSFHAQLLKNSSHRKPQHKWEHWNFKCIFSEKRTALSDNECVSKLRQKRRFLKSLFKNNKQPWAVCSTFISCRVTKDSKTSLWDLFLITSRKCVRILTIRTIKEMHETDGNKKKTTFRTAQAQNMELWHGNLQNLWRSRIDSHRMSIFSLCTGVRNPYFSWPTSEPGTAVCFCLTFWPHHRFSAPSFLTPV